ncbi:MAG: 23S rRNA pseudouridine1911/1915/1917 synthase [Sphingobacteriales bacterium]
MAFPEVIYEDNHFIAVNKKPGELVQGDKTGEAPLGEDVKEFIRMKYQKPGNIFLGVIHRIDRPVSGVLLMAKTSKGLARMNEVFKQRTVQKTYWAIVTKRPNDIEGKLEHYLLKDQKRNVVKTVNAKKAGAKLAQLSYKMIKDLGKAWVLEVKPHTGRAHQIRVQLASMGCPIVGDLKYGAPTPNHDKSISLHAKQLDFVHPVSKETICIEADPPRNGAWFGV